MTALFDKTKLFVLAGLIFSAYACYALVMMNDRGSAWLTFSYGIIFSICLFCFGGLWMSKRWAWVLSLVLALAGLGLGVYFVHFAWTFWIFKQPTFFERIFAVFNPRIFIFIFFPLIWILHFLKPGVRASFQS